MYRIRVSQTFLTVSLLLLVAAPSADALPAFAKKWGLTCSACHNAWPMLNAFGRKFKENGYRLDRNQELSDEDHVKGDAFALFKGTPLSGRVKGFLVNKLKDEETHISPFHEFEGYLSGNAFDQVSYFVEFEGEDEVDWKLAFEIGMVGWHPREEFNAMFGRSPIFWIDPYQTFATAGRRLTVEPSEFDLQGYGDSGQTLHDTSNQMMAYGRLGGRFLYEVGINTGIDDPEGEDDVDFVGRGAVDITTDFMVGGFLWDGNAGIGDASLGFSRGGIDFQYQSDAVSVFGSYMRATDDHPEGGSQGNNAFKIDGLYTFRKDKRTVIMPLVSFDYYTLNDGADSVTDGTFNLTAYPWENFNVGAEFWTQLDTPSGEKDSRFTLIFNATF